MLTESLISLDDATSAIVSAVHTVETEKAGVINTAGRTLAEEIVSEDGRVLIERGVVIGAAEMGMLAEIGRAGILVHRRPRVSIVTTGDEFVDVLETVEDGKFRNINRYSLAGRVFSSDCDLGKLPHAGDSVESVRRALHTARMSDLIVVAGGALNGKRDCVREVIRESAEIVFDGLPIDPGTDTAFALLGGKPVFVLSGEPVGAMVAFELCVRPALVAMLGRRYGAHTKARAVVAESLGWGWERRGFLPGVAAFVAGHLAVRTLGRGSMKDMVEANCLVVVPERTEAIDAGDELDVMLFGMPL